MSSELKMAVDNLSEQEVLMKLVEQGEWLTADGSVFDHDNFNGLWGDTDW